MSGGCLVTSAVPNDDIKADERPMTAGADNSQSIYDLGDYIELSENRFGYIRFQGSLPGFGECVGVELDVAVASGNNGTFMNQSHFECDEGKGIFVKIAKILCKKNPTPMVNSAENKNTAKNSKKSVISSSNSSNTKSNEDPQKKPKKKNTKKKSKRPKTPHDSKSTTPKKSTSSTFSYTSKKSKNASAKNTGSPRMNKKKLKKPASASARKSAKKNVSKNKKTFDIPPNKSNKEKIKFVLSNLNDNKSSFKARMQIMKECARILQDEKCDEDAAKFAIDGYKKPYVTQLSDKKMGVQREAINVVAAMVSAHGQLFRKQTQHYLKNTIQIYKNNDAKVIKVGDVCIKLMITQLTVKDNKQLSIIVAEFIREATSSKSTFVRKQCWVFVNFVLTFLSENARKLPKVVAEVLQTGLKSGISDSNKQVQSAAMSALNMFSFLDETRAERVISRLSSSARAAYEKMHNSKRLSDKTGISKHRKSSSKLLFNKKNKKGKKLKNTKKAKTTKTVKSNTKTKRKKKVKKSLVEQKCEEMKDDKISKSKKKKKSSNSADTSISDDGSVQSEASTATIITMSSTGNVDGKAIVDDEEIINGDPVTEEVAVVVDVDDNTGVEEIEMDVEPGGRRTHGRRHGSKPLMGGNLVGFEIPNVDEDEVDETPPVPHLEDEHLSLSDEDVDDDDDDDDEDEDSSNDESSAASKEITQNMNDGGTIEEARDLITSFLELKDPQVNWKMIEFLSKDNMTHLLMSYISRFPSGPKIWTEDLNIDFEVPIPETLALYSDEVDEIRCTQLSYSLMRILSNEHAAETVKSFLLRKCQEICLHALAVFHPHSKGNVYHGRVVLEILLNHWPKSFMSALANQRHIQSLLKVALFRNLHQGNLNSFFLDLICFRPNQKMGQIQPVKKKLMKMFVDWKFMEYLLDAAASAKHGDDVATKYATFFIDMVARCASIPEAGELFEGYEHYIIDSFMKGLLDEDNTRSTWHRISCGQTLVQFLDISSRPTIMDPAQAMAGMLGVLPPDPNPNILNPMFEDSLKRLHSYIPQMCSTITKIHKNPNLPSIELSSRRINRPYGQVRLNCLELLTVSADFAQFKCGTVLSMLEYDFWSVLLDMAFVHNSNNMFLCHFRRLIHLSMIFRRRFLKHLFVNGKLLERFVDFYNVTSPRQTLHGYILQMLWDIYNHDQRDDDEDENGMDENNNNNGGNDGEVDDDVQSETGSVEILKNEEDDEDEDEDEDSGGLSITVNGSGVADDEEFTEEDLILRPNFSKDPEDQWDIVAFFDANEQWKKFFPHVSRQMDYQNATEQSIPNMNVANNQQQLDALLTNLLGGASGGGDEEDSSSTESSDSDEEVFYGGSQQ